MIKTISKLGENFLNLIKGTSTKQTKTFTNMILNGQNLILSPKTVKWQECYQSYLISFWKPKRNKRCKDWNRRNKLPLFKDCMITHLKIPIYKIFIEHMNVARLHNIKSTQKSILFLYTVRLETKNFKRCYLPWLPKMQILRHKSNETDIRSVYSKPWNTDERNQ